MSPAHPRVVAVMLLAAPFVPLTSHVAVRSTAHSWKCPRAPAALRGGTDRMLDHRQISWPSEEENEDRPAPTQGRYLRTHSGFLFKVVGSDDADGSAAAGGAVPHEAESSAVGVSAGGGGGDGAAHGANAESMRPEALGRPSRPDGALPKPPAAPNVGGGLGEGGVESEDAARQRAEGASDTVGAKRRNKRRRHDRRAMRAALFSRSRDPVTGLIRVEDIPERLQAGVGEGSRDSAVLYSNLDAQRVLVRRESRRQRSRGPATTDAMHAHDTGAHEQSGGGHPAGRHGRKWGARRKDARGGAALMGNFTAYYGRRHASAALASFTAVVAGRGPNACGASEVLYNGSDGRFRAIWADARCWPLLGVEGRLGEGCGPDHVQVNQSKLASDFVIGDWALQQVPAPQLGCMLGPGVWWDPRLALLRPEWFAGKTCLDIGCNSGYLTMSIANGFKCASMLGVDCDPALIAQARRIKRSIRWSGAGDRGTAEEFLGREQRRDGGESNTCTDRPRIYFQQRDVMAVGAWGAEEKYDTITCMSVTKWLHLHHGDEGIASFFRTCHRLLQDGGLLILEPQAWKSYQRRRNLSPLIKSRLTEGPDMIRIRPDTFSTHLLPDAGFRSVEYLGKPAGLTPGFSRPVYLCRK